MRNRRDRGRTACPTCGKQVTVRRDGALMAHQNNAGEQCQRPAWQDKQAAAAARAARRGSGALLAVTLLASLLLPAGAAHARSATPAPTECGRARLHHGTCPATPAHTVKPGTTHPAPHFPIRQPR